MSDPLDDEGKAREAAQAEGEAQAEAQAEADEATAQIDSMATPIKNGRILGINRRHYPAQASVIGHSGFYVEGIGMVDQSEDPPPTLAVLVQGEIGDYACYVGHGTPEWVRDHGDKIKFEEACCHFPGGQLKRELYRE